MALEAIPSVYQEAVKIVQKPKAEVLIQATSPANIHITETPAVSAESKQTGNEQTKDQKENSATNQQIKEAVTRANNQLKPHRTRCEFSYHEETKRVSIKIVDKDTKETIKEIPPEETLEMIEKMWELAGILVDEKR
ncbi:MAG: flagellar protein FlaG [Mobilitalea sp.]